MRYVSKVPSSLFQIAFTNFNITIPFDSNQVARSELVFIVMSDYDITVIINADASAIQIEVFIQFADQVAKFILKVLECCVFVSADTKVHPNIYANLLLKFSDSIKKPLHVRYFILFENFYHSRQHIIGLTSSNFLSVIV